MSENDWSAPRPAASGEPQWEREALREIALEGIRERRRARRWGIFFKLLLAVYLGLLLVVSMRIGPFGGTGMVSGAHTAVVDVDGVIASDSPASAARIVDGLEAAFTAEGVQGVILRINSPGGSPVQAGRVNDAIQRLRAAHPDTPLYAVAGDVCASGAYYIAAAADRIYADKASIVGSIGVVMGGFGFTDAIDRLGVERRLYTAGRNKALMDPFSDVQDRHVSHVQGMLDTIHQQFIDTVKAGRGDRLKGEDDEIFSGLYWTGAESVDLGLTDGLASPADVARDVIGVERTVNYTPRESVLDRLAERVGAASARVIQEHVLMGPGALR